MKLSLCALFAAAAAFSVAQDTQENPRTISIFFGKSAILLGSSDVRYGGGIAYDYGKHEPRFENRYVTAQLVMEGYYDNTIGNGQHYPKDEADALGFLYYARWFPRMSRERVRPYFDLGWGFQYADRPSEDLPSEINSTPFFDLGLAIPAGKKEVMLSFRYLHISNGGLVPPNRGQNQLYLMAGLNF